jgi:hypothetical protein
MDKEIKQNGYLAGKGGVDDASSAFSYRVSRRSIIGSRFAESFR